MEKEIGVTEGREGERVRIRVVGVFFHRFPNPYVSYVSSSEMHRPTSGRPCPLSLSR